MASEKQGGDARVINLSVVKNALEAAALAAPANPPPAEKPAPKAPAVQSGGAGAMSYSTPELPENCPVIPLGEKDDVCYYLTASNQLSKLKAEKHGRLSLQKLFGDQVGVLYAAYPRHKRDGTVDGWRAELLSEAMMAACARKGIWDPQERVRGIGAWTGENGELILHCGTKIWIGPAPGGDETGGKWTDTRVIGRYVYPADAAMARPWAEPAPAGNDGPATALLQILKMWNWRRGELDALLLLGWICAAMIGGALRWRPVMWITGGTGTGKSTLQNLIIEPIFDGGLLALSDTSEAGIRQTLGHSTLPVAVDELEADADGRKQQAIIGLARLAASGGRLSKGGADHVAVEFVARSCFLFAAINVPGLLPQDRNRTAILELQPVPAGRVVPTINDAAIRTVGAGLRRRMADGWSRLPQVLEVYRAALAAVGHSARGCDQYGTLLACADLALHDHEICSDYAAELAALLTPAAVAEWGDAEISDEQRCLDHLMTSAPDVFKGGGRRMVAALVETAANGMALDADDANNLLAAFGLKVIRENGDAWLAVANSHQGLAGLFERSHWAGRSGAAGVWVQALRRLPGAKPDSRRFAGRSARCTLIPLAVVLDTEKSKS